MQHLLFFFALNLWVYVCVSKIESEWAFEDQGGKQAEAKLHRREWACAVINYPSGFQTPLLTASYHQPTFIQTWTPIHTHTHKEPLMLTYNVHHKTGYKLYACPDTHIAWIWHTHTHSIQSRCISHTQLPINLYWISIQHNIPPSHNDSLRKSDASQPSTHTQIHSLAWTFYKIQFHFFCNAMCWC